MARGETEDGKGMFDSPAILFKECWKCAYSVMHRLIDLQSLKSLFTVL